MPKQSGIYQIKGKFEQRSYYRPKNMSTGVFRSINQQMSERVKTEPNYANTRNYAGEFGCASSWANQVASYLNTLAPISNLAKKRADIAHSALGMIRQDSTHEFGRRTLTVDGWQNTMMSMLNNMPRVSFDGNFGSAMSFYSFADTTAGSGKYKVHVHIPSVTNLSERLKAIGADYVTYRVLVCRWEAGYFSTLLGSYYPTELATEQVAYLDPPALPLDRDYDCNFVLDGSYPRFWFLKVLVVATPIRDINGEAYPLEHMRTFKFFDLERGDTYISEVNYAGQTYRPGAVGFELDVTNYPGMMVKMHIQPGTTISHPTATVNGKTCTVVSAPDNSYLLQLASSLDGEIMRVVALTSGGKTYTFTTNS